MRQRTFHFEVRADDAADAHGAVQRWIKRRLADAIDTRQGVEWIGKGRYACTVKVMRFASDRRAA